MIRLPTTRLGIRSDSTPHRPRNFIAEPSVSQWSRKPSSGNCAPRLRPDSAAAPDGTPFQRFIWVDIAWRARHRPRAAWSAGTARAGRSSLRNAAIAAGSLCRCPTSEGGCNLLEPLLEPGFAEAVEDMVDRVRVVKASQDACGI